MSLLITLQAYICQMAVCEAEVMQDEGAESNAPIMHRLLELVIECSLVLISMLTSSPSRPLSQRLAATIVDNLPSSIADPSVCKCKARIGDMKFAPRTGQLISLIKSLACMAGKDLFRMRQACHNYNA